MFLVEQNAFHALKLAHRGYVMVNGQITMSGTGAGTAGAAGSARGLSRGRPLMGGWIWADSRLRLAGVLRARRPRRGRGGGDGPRLRDILEPAHG